MELTVSSSETSTLITGGSDTLFVRKIASSARFVNFTFMAQPFNLSQISDCKFHIFYVTLKKTGSCIQVKLQLKQGEVLQKAKHFTSDAPIATSDVLYKTHGSYIEIITNHFTKFIVTAKEIECCCHSAVVLVFSRMDRESSPTIADIRIRFASLHYEKQDYLQVNFLLLCNYFN